MNKQSIDKRMKELEEEMLLLSDYLGEAVDKKMGARLGELQKYLESIPAQSTGGDTGKINASVEKELAALKAELGKISTAISSSISKTDKKALAENLSNVSGSVNDVITSGLDNFSGSLNDAISQKLDKATGTITGSVKGNIDSISKTVGDISGKIDSLPATLDKSITGKLSELSGTVDDSLSRQADILNNSLSGQIDTVSGHINESLANISETVSGSLAGKLDKITGTVTENITGLAGKFDEISDSLTQNIADELKSLSGTVSESLDSLDNSLQDTVKKTESAQGELKKTVTEHLDTIQKSISAMEKLVSLEGETTLGGELARISGAVDALSSDLPEKTERIETGVAKLENDMQTAMQSFDKKRDELKTAITNDIKKINENVEVVRRMCTTDEEKFLGSMTTSIHGIVENTFSDLEDLSAKVKQWFLTLDNNLQVAEKHLVQKQDEMKKILSFDIKAIAETTTAIKANCDTTSDDRTLGGEMLFVGDKVDVMSGQVPDIQEKVTNLSEQLDRVSAEVMRMRWYVIGAAAVSIIVLVSSFFV